MTKRYGSDYVGQLLHDFMEATPILKENIRTHTFRDVEDDAEFVTDNGGGGWWSSDKPTFEIQEATTVHTMNLRKEKPKLSAAWKSISRKLKLILEPHLIW